MVNETPHARYTLDAMRIARSNGHTMEHAGTCDFKVPRYSVDKYLCKCGRAEVQISTSSFIGCWLNAGAQEPCPTPLFFTHPS